MGINLLVQKLKKKSLAVKIIMLSAFHTSLTTHSPASCNSHKTAVQETTKTMVWPSRILGETKVDGIISALQNDRDLLLEMSRHYQK